MDTVVGVDLIQQKVGGASLGVAHEEASEGPGPEVSIHHLGGREENVRNFLGQRIPCEDEVLLVNTTFCAPQDLVVADFFTPDQIAATVVEGAIQDRALKTIGMGRPFPVLVRFGVLAILGDTAIEDPDTKGGSGRR